MLITALLWLYTWCLRALPAPFRTEFAEEMAEVFQDLLSAKVPQGLQAVLAAAAREFCCLPLVLWRIHRHERSRRSGLSLWPWAALPSPFHPAPRDHNGPDSWLQTLLESGPLLIAGAALLVSTYAQPSWFSSVQAQSWSDTGAWVFLLATPICLLGLARGLPRWSYAPAGLLLGYLLFSTQSQGLFVFWIGALLAAYGLLLAAVYVHLHRQPLAPALQRMGRNLVLDWTRASLGFYALLPFAIIAAFNTVRNDRTACFGLAVLAMCLGALACCRSRSQQGALGALAAATTAVFSLAAVEQHMQLTHNEPLELVWLVALWVGMLALLLLPAPGSMLCRMWHSERSPHAER
jgi:hypothetical protein